MRLGPRLTVESVDTVGPLFGPGGGHAGASRVKVPAFRATFPE
jgi:hypothetical protein